MLSNEGNLACNSEVRTLVCFTVSSQRWRKPLRQQKSIVTVTNSGNTTQTQIKLSNYKRAEKIIVYRIRSPVDRQQCFSIIFQKICYQFFKIVVSRKTGKLEKYDVGIK